MGSSNSKEEDARVDSLLKKINNENAQEIQQQLPKNKELRIKKIYHIKPEFENTNTRRSVSVNRAMPPFGPNNMSYRPQPGYVSTMPVRSRVQSQPLVIGTPVIASNPRLNFNRKQSIPYSYGYVPNHNQITYY